MNILSIFAVTLLATALNVQGAANTCNPQQGQVNEYDFDLTGFQTGCGGTTVTITSGTEHFKTSWNVVQNGNTYSYCGKTHYNTPNGKAIDSDGNQYNLISVGNSDSSSSSDYSSSSFDGQYSTVSIFKLVGHGKAENSQIKFNTGCTYHYDPTNGYTSKCNRDNAKISC